MADRKYYQNFCTFQLLLKPFIIFKPFLILVPSGAMNEPDVCFSWRSHVKTFDGRYIYFPGRCTYKLIHDCQDDLFSVHMFTDPHCKDTETCRRAVNLYLGGLDIKVINTVAFLVFLFLKLFLPLFPREIQFQA